MRINSTLEIDMYRKVTSTITTIHFKSNHPMEQQLAACWDVLLIVCIRYR